MFTLLRLSLLCISLIVLTDNYAQQIYMEHLTLEDGLLSNQILDIDQDSSGYIWMVCSRGITRYDGSRFRHYLNKDIVAEGFVPSSAMRIFRDRKGGIWTSNASGGLFSYDPFKDKFIIRNTPETRLPAVGLACWQDEKGNFWIGTLNEGLCHFDLNNNRLINHRRHESLDSLSDNLITDISPGYEEGIVTISTTKGTCLYNTRERKFIRLWYNSGNPSDTYKHNVIRDFLETKDAYYAGTYGGLHVTDKSTFSVRHYYAGGEPGTTLNYNSIWGLEEDADGKIWIAVYGGGINIFDPSTGKFSYITRENSTLGENNLKGIFKDSEGNKWVLTDNTGVVKVDSRKSWIRRITFKELGIDGVMGIAERDSVLWIGANGGGLISIDLKTGKHMQFHHDPGNPLTIGYDHVSSTSIDPEGNVWIALAGGGLDYFDVDDRTFTHHTFKQGENSISNNAVSEVLWTDSVIWYGTFGNGFGTYDTRNNEFSNYRFPVENPEKYVEVNVIHQDASGNIWILTNVGVALYDKRLGKLISLIHSSKPEMPVNSFGFHAIGESNGRILLLNADNELVETVYTQASSVKFTKIRLTGVLGDEEQLRKILNYGENSLWIASNSRILNFAKDSWDSYDSKDGLLGNEFYSTRFQGGSEFVAVSDEGLNIIDPSRAYSPDFGPKVRFESISILNRPVNVGKPDSLHGIGLEKHLNYLNTVELEYWHKEFTISYSAVQYYSSEAVRYRYRLVGFADDWIEDITDSKVSYTNLDADTYRFEVQASLAPGIWGPVKSLNIRINPPFYQTWWFISLVLLIFAGLLYFLHYYRLQKALAVANLRTQIAQDLHDDIGSSLTKISLYSSLMSEEDSSGSGFLQTIGQLSREVIGQMSDIVWSVDQKNDTAGNMISRMRQFAAETLDACDIGLNFSTENVNHDAFIDPLFRQNFYLIFKEAINNICKHSKARSVDVIVSGRNGSYQLHITDDGEGIGKRVKISTSGTEEPVRSYSRGNGLQNMKKRAERIGLRFEISSRAGSGTIIDVS